MKEKLTMQKDIANQKQFGWVRLVLVYSLIKIFGEKKNDLQKHCSHSSLLKKDKIKITSFV